MLRGNIARRVERLEARLLTEPLNIYMNFAFDVHHVVVNGRLFEKGDNESGGDFQDRIRAEVGRGVVLVHADATSVI